MKKLPEPESGIQSDEALEALFAHAAARPLPRADREVAIREQVKIAWKQGIRLRQQRRYTKMAMAASFVAAAIVGMLWYQSLPLTNGSTALATVQKRFGEVQIADESGIPYYPSSGTFELVPGQSIRTGDEAGMAMTWKNGGSLRLGEHTAVSLTAANEIYLQHGRLYFDSDPATNSATAVRAGSRELLAIRTDQGRVTPLGTRYVTQQLNDRLEVMVRQGKIAVESAGYSAIAMEGERLLMSRDDAPVVVPVDSYGEEWDWIERTTPAWNAEGRTIFEFLSWVSRESGRPIRFDTPAAERLARTESLVGYGLVDMEPTVALRLVLMTTDLDWTIKDGTVVVTERQPDVSANFN